MVTNVGTLPLCVPAPLLNASTTNTDSSRDGYAFYTSAMSLSNVTLSDIKCQVGLCVQASKQASHWAAATNLEMVSGANSCHVCGVTLVSVGVRLGRHDQAVAAAAPH